MRKWLRVSGLAAGVGMVLLTAVTPAPAHHAFSAEFDANQPVRLEGTVTRMQWINPHTWIHIEVTQPDGSVEEWAIECGTPNVLFRRGLTKQSMPPGTVLVVDGYRSKDGSRRANGRDVAFTDGTTAFVGSSGTGAPYEAPGGRR